MKDTILAYDLSFTKTGWCLIQNSKILKRGSFALTGSCRGEKLNCLYLAAAKQITEFEPDIISIEDVFFSRFTAQSFKPLLMLQSIMKLLAFRLNRSEPQRFLASEVRAGFDITPKLMKKKFVEYCKKNGYSKDSKKKAKTRYEDFKKNFLVDFVNDIYPKLLTYKEHDIADAILLGLHTEKICC